MTVVCVLTEGAVYKPAVEIVPTVLLPPVTPFTSQVTAVLLEFVTVAENCRVANDATVAVVGEIPTLTAAAGGSIVTAADADLVVSACETAAMVTVVTAATLGAVYKPAAEIVPNVELPPAIPLTSQVTAVLVAFDTVAENCLVAEEANVIEVGERATLTAGGAGAGTVTRAAADLLVSACETAATVTDIELVTVVGAVNMPAAEIVPVAGFPPVTPFTIHVTAVSVALATVAVNCFEVAGGTVAAVGAILTLTVGVVTGCPTIRTPAESEREGLACDTAVTLTQP